MLHFSKNLKYLRELKGLKQADIQNVINFNRTTWNGYETGKSFPNFKDLIKIAYFFNISEADLIHTDLTKGLPTSEKISPIEEDRPKELILENLLLAHKETLESLRNIIEAKNEIIELLKEKLDKRKE